VTVLWGCYNIVSEISNNWFGLNCRFETGKGENFFAYTLLAFSILWSKWHIIECFMFCLIACAVAGLWLIGDCMISWYRRAGTRLGARVSVEYQLNAGVTACKHICITCTVFEIWKVELYLYSLMVLKGKMFPSLILFWKFNIFRRFRPHAKSDD
jgi:hypothetical protein